MPNRHVMSHRQAMPHRKRRSTVMTVISILIGLYGVVVLAAWLGQRKLLYAADPTRAAPASLGLTGVVERELATPDGASLVTWRAAPAPGRPTILYFHGNAGTLANRSERVRRFTRDGFGLFMMSYRGYSGSTGTPSEHANVADGRRAYDTLRADGVRAEDIVVFGESLGSGIAVQLAAEVPVRAIVLDAPYTSMVDVAAGHYPYLPVRPLLVDRYDSASRIAHVKAPLLIVHGERDGIVPVALGRGLFAHAVAPKEIVIFPSGRHSDLFSVHGAHDVVERWLQRVAER